MPHEAPLQGLADAQTNGAAQSDGRRSFKPDQRGRDHRTIARLTQLTANGDASSRCAHQSGQCAGQDDAQIDGAAQTDGAATSCDAGDDESAQHGRDRLPAAPLARPAVYSAPLSAPHQSVQRAGQDDAQSDGAAQSDGSAMTTATGGAESAKVARDARARTTARPATLMEQLAHRSVQRLRDLMDADGTLQLHPQVDARAADIRVPLSVVRGRDMDRGNPFRPGAMRRAGTGNNPAGTEAMHAVHRLLMPCSAKGCTALVDRVAAIKSANADGRSRLRDGDGCGASGCSDSWQPSQFAPRQLQFSADVLTAHRLIYRRTAHAACGQGWLVNTADTVAMARAAVRGALPHASGNVRALVRDLAPGLAPSPPAALTPVGSDDDFVIAPPRDGPPPSLPPSPALPPPSPTRAGGSDVGELPRPGPPPEPPPPSLPPSPAHGDDEPTLALRLTGGGGSDDEHEAMACTQAVGFDDACSALAEEPRLVPVVDGTLDEVGSVDLPTSPGSVFSIGRVPSSSLKLVDAALTDQCVHREHATITLAEGGAYELRLVGKGMSTFINEVPLHHIALPWQTYEQPPVVLSDGDTLRFGGQPSAGYSKFIYVFCAADAEQPDREASPLVPAPTHKPNPAKAAKPVRRTPVLPTQAAPSVPAHGTAPELAAAPAQALEGVAIAARLTSPRGNIELDSKPRDKTSLGDGVAFVVTTKVQGFDLHVQGAGVSHARGTAAAVELNVGAQRSLHNGDRLTLGGCTYTCMLPPELNSKPAPAASAALPSAALPAADPTATAETAQAAARELALLAEREAQVRAQLTSGLQGKQLREAQRGLSAAHDALVGVALGAATSTDAEHAVRVAANQLKKVADDTDRKRRHEEVAAGTAATKAQRRQSHPAPAPPAQRTPVGRAPGAKRDRRTFENRTQARKKRRVEEDARRHVEVVGGGSGAGKGKGKGKGKGGGPSGGKGGRGGGGWHGGGHGWHGGGRGGGGGGGGGFSGRGGGGRSGGRGGDTFVERGRYN